MKNPRSCFILFILLGAALPTACGPAARPTPDPAVAAAAPAQTTLLPSLPPQTPAPPPEPRTLTVFAAASLTDAFREIGANFEAANPDVSVALSFAGSQTLSTQLIQGAAADVFASTNETEMDKLVSANLVRTDTPRDFLTNQFIIILPANNPAGVQSLQDLARPGLKLVLADKTVPAGNYALQILDNMARDSSYGVDFKTRVLANVASNENDVKQVVVKVQLGEADAGIVYVSDAVAATDFKTIQIPANMNVIARYPIATLANARQPQLAAAFIAYVLSSDGQATLKKWGFTPITP